MDSLPILLIAGPLVAALAAVMVGRWPRVAAGLGVVVALGLAILLVAVGRGPEPVVASWVVAGRAFELSPFNALFLTWLAAGLALLFTLHGYSPGPKALVPGGLAALAFLAAAQMVQPFAFGAVFLLAATAVVVPSLYGGRYTSATEAWRAFLAVALALPLLIAAGWLLDSGQAQSDAAHGVLLFATLLLVGGFPFYVWLSGVARQAPLPAVALLVGVVGAGSAVWLAQVLNQFPVARGSVVFETAVLGSVLLSSLVAAFGLSRAVGWRDWLAYGLVFDAGLQVAALSMPGAATAAVVAVGVIGRLIVILLLVALAGWAAETGPAKVWRRILWALAGLGLLGLPLTPLFAARWATFNGLAAQSPLVLGLVLVTLGVAVVSMVRWAMVGVLPGHAHDQSGTLGAVLVGFIALLTVLMGLLSPLLLEYLARLVSG